MADPVIQRWRADQRFVTRTDWLVEYTSFSFGSHYDPANTGFGPLLVHNEEWLRPGAGFDSHPHADAEIITWVLSGALVHTDSSGQQGIVYPGLAQRMSAGSGIEHSERNDAYHAATGYRIDPQQVTEPAHYLQMWVRPDQSGLEPAYGQQELNSHALASDWVPVASAANREAAVEINASQVTLWATTLDPGQTRTLPCRRQLAHVFVARGSVDCEAVGILDAGDALRITGAEPLGVTAREPAEVLVWEMADARS